MSEATKRTRAKDEPAHEARLTALLREAHARLHLWKTCSDGACRHNRRCGGDGAQCGARLAPESWAWLRQVVQAMLRGESQDAAIAAANLANLGYRQKRTVRWHVKCWDPIDFVQLHDGSWVRIDQVPPRPPIDPQVVALAASDWLRSALRADGRGEAREEVRGDAKGGGAASAQR